MSSRLTLGKIVDGEDLLNLAKSGPVIQTKSAVAMRIIGKTRGSRAAESVKKMSVRKLKGTGFGLIETLPNLSMVSIFPSLGQGFMHRLRGEIMGSRFSNETRVWACANRIKEACVEHVPDDGRMQIQNAGGRTDILIYSDHDGGVGKTCLSVRVSGRVVIVKITSFFNCSLTITTGYCDKSPEFPNVTWEFELNESGNGELISKIMSIIMTEAQVDWSEG